MKRSAHSSLGSGGDRLVAVAPPLERRQSPLDVLARWRGGWGGGPMAHDGVESIILESINPHVTQGYLCIICMKLKTQPQ